MSTEHKPIMEEELATLEEAHRNAAKGPVFVPSQIARLADNVPRLIAEIRRQRRAAVEGHPVGPNGDRWGCEIEIERLQSEAFSRSVEIDNLRKMLVDANAREQLLIETVNAYKQQRLDERPTPMCKVDPVADLFPPARGEVNPS